MVLLEGLLYLALFVGVVILGVAVVLMVTAWLLLPRLPRSARRAAAVALGSLTAIPYASMVGFLEPHPFWLLAALPGIAWGFFVPVDQALAVDRHANAQRPRLTLWRVVAVVAVIGGLTGLGLEQVQGPLALATDRRTDGYQLSAFTENAPPRRELPDLDADGVLLAIESDGRPSADDGYVDAAFSPSGDYWIHYTCEGVSLQFAEVTGREGSSSARRHLVPCSGAEPVRREAPLPGPGHDAELRIFPAGVQYWAIVVTESSQDPFGR
jgi:hypothetical protein